MGEEKQKKKGLSGALKKFYGVGDCGFTLMSNIESYYFSIFLTNAGTVQPSDGYIHHNRSQYSRRTYFLDLRSNP